MKVAIRVDASRVMGTGHVRRCLALAHALIDAGSEIVFVLRETDVDAVAVVSNEGFRAIQLPTGATGGGSGDGPYAHWLGASLSEDADDTIQALKEERPDWIVVDHYTIDASWHETVAGALGSRICVIDDLANRRLACDIVVDHNVSPDHTALYAPRVSARTSILGGPRFALLGPAFVSADPLQVGPEVNSVGVFMGGIDLGDHTSTVLAALDGLGYAGAIEVVTTTANPHLADLKAHIAQRPNTRLSVDLPNLSAFFARHDLQIGAGGGATWERCRMGAPTLMLVVAENQRRSAELLADWGVVAPTEPSDDTSRAAIENALGPLIGDTDLRRGLSEKALQLVDGLGARRVALKIAKDSLKVRRARLDDARLIHAWRDHPVTRAVSRNAREIPLEDHLRWFEAALKDDQRTILIGVIGNLPVGIVRFDRLAEGSAEVSIYLDPAFHALGLGRKLLLAAEVAAPGGLDIVAETLEENDASQGLFASAGYRRLGPTQWMKPAPVGQR
jgi:UDP-2,4-diacetamido-2,4,6-trideoxy-beta-L-altropyranose hydrolase